MRFIALLVAGFLFLSSLEAWAGYWLGGRWLISSRYASLTLGKVKQWMDRGIITSTTQTAKVLIQKNGKWILLTLGLSQVILEVQRRAQGVNNCYIPSGSIRVAWNVFGSFVVEHHGYSPRELYTVSYSRTCTSGSANVPAVEVWQWYPDQRRWRFRAFVPNSISVVVGNCPVEITLLVQNPCPSGITSGNAPAPSQAWQNERRRVPVRVFPRVEHFVRPDVVEADSSLRWLRDEYQRISNDPSIPLIPSDALGDLDLPSIDWAIPPDEALDHASESSRPGEGSREGEVEGDLSFPGLNTDLNIPERRSFPSELLNSIVQSHPLLSVLQGVSLDAGGGGSCVIGSRPFEFDFCSFGWVLNLMGAVIVFVAFLTGLFWAGRSD